MKSQAKHSHKKGKWRNKENLCKNRKNLVKRKLKAKSRNKQDKQGFRELSSRDSRRDCYQIQQQVVERNIIMKKIKINSIDPSTEF